MITRIDARGRTTIPKGVRAAPGLAPGARIIWSVDPDGTARVRRCHEEDEAYLRSVEATLSEWGEEADDDVYGDL